MNSEICLLLSFLGTLLLYTRAQDGTLPDSISNINCMMLQMNSPHICCDSDTGNFCPIQCNNGICMCVDETTGDPISDLRFPENAENINCDTIIIPLEPAATTDVEPTEGPTTDDPGDEEESDSSETSDSEETSFSDSDSTDTRSDISGSSGTTRTNNTRSGTSRTNTTRSAGRSRATRTNETEESYSETSDTRSNSGCPTVRKLLAKGCIQRCILEDSEGCPACNRTCLDLEADSLPSAEVTCSCTNNQVCLRVGRFGKPKCFDSLAEGERCDGDDDEDDRDNGESGDYKDEESVSDFDETSGYSARRRVSGARDRFIFGDLGVASIGCQEDLFCVPVGAGRSECRPENPNGTCVIARQEGVNFDCAQDGSFEPLQCQPEGEDLRCVCVQPKDGTPIGGTQVIVDDVEDAPNNCAKLVGCTIERGGQTFDVDHGDYFVDADNCQRCLCSNGVATSCEPSVCTALQQAPPDCIYQGQSYRHGENFQVDCNMCGCRNGELRCTRQRCEGTEFRDMCQDCQSQPQVRVCGINGVTYPSSCVALYCAGIAPFDIVPGDCPSVDVCTLHPCGEGERCLRKGGAACFDANGCDPDDLRTCVNLTSLMCEDEIIPDQSPESVESDPVSDNPAAVCGTNGITYPSLCHLLQDTGNEAVAYAGGCNREDCQGGPVCGTDGVTYENVCVLRAQSANARVDFYGACEAPEDSPVEYCERVSRARRCIFDTSNCRHLVRPEEGCCALCGGITFVAIDFAGLRDYVRINPRARTLDAFLEILVESGFIDQEITERCELEGTLTRTRNIQITLSARRDGDSDFCNNASERLAAAINDPSSVSDDPRFAQVPEVLQFASAAVAAPNTAAALGIDEKGDGMNGATVVTTLSCLTLMLLSTLTFSLFM